MVSVAVRLVVAPGVVDLDVPDVNPVSLPSVEDFEQKIEEDRLASEEAAIGGDEAS